MRIKMTTKCEERMLVFSGMRGWASVSLLFLSDSFFDQCNLRQAKHWKTGERLGKNDEKKELQIWEEKDNRHTDKARKGKRKKGKGKAEAAENKEWESDWLTREMNGTNTSNAMQWIEKLRSKK